MRLIDERLHFDQKRPRTFLSDENGGSRNVRFVFREENSGWIRHAAQTMISHGKDAKFVDRAKSIFEGSDESKVRMRIALKIKHRIHDVFEHSRPSERTFFGDVPHKKERSAGSLGRTGKSGRAFAHLRHGARSAVERAGKKCLNRIYDDEFRAFFIDDRFDVLKLNFTHQLETRRRQLQPLSAKRNLRGTLFTGNVNAAEPRSRQASHHLQQKGRLADPRIAANQRNAALNKTAAHDAVEFGEPRNDARSILCCHIGKILQSARRINEAAAGA